MPPRGSKRKSQASSSSTKKYEEEYEKYTFDELRQTLLQYGENPGPIDGSNKSMYVRLLTRKRIKLETDEGTPAPKSSLSFSSSYTSSSDNTTSPPHSQPSSSSSSSSSISFSHTPSSLSRPPLRKSSSPQAQPGSHSTSLRVVSTAKKPSSKSPGTRGKQGKTLKKNDVFQFSVNGLVAATFTPFTSSGELNLKAIGPYAEWLYQTGVHSVFVNGTAGESLSLTVNERQSVLETWLKECSGRFTVIAHVGCESIKDTCELAQHAEKSGAGAIGVMPTTFFKPQSIDSLVSYLSMVATAAPNLPLFYYHIPSMTGVNLNMEELLDEAGSRLPTLRGIKYSSMDLHQMSGCVTHSNGKYSILYGCDQQLLGALVMGCTAAVGSTYNYMGKLNNRLLTAVRNNDLVAARLEQRRSQAVVKLLEKYYGGHAGVGKEFMRQRFGIDLGPPRLPLLPLPPGQVAELKKSLRDLGFFDWT